MRVGGPLIRYDWCPYKKEAGIEDGDTQGGRQPCDTEAEIGMGHRQTKEVQELPETTRSQNWQARAHALKLQREGGPAHTLISDFWPPEL